MVSLWALAFLFLDVINDGRQPWIEPLPTVRIEPTRPFRRERDFGPDSAYGLMLRAAEVSFENVLGAEGWESLLTRFRDHPFPVEPPQPFAEQGPWPARDYATIRVVLEHAAPHLALARQAVAAPDPQVPTPDSLAFPLPYLANARSLGRLLTVSAYAKETTGDVAGAMDDLVTCIRLGNLVSRGGCLINHLVDIAMTSIATDALYRIAMRGEVPSETLRRTAGELLEIAGQVEPFAEVMRHEAVFGLASIDLVQRHGVEALGQGKTSLAHKLATCVTMDSTGSSPAAMRRDLTYLYQHLVGLAEKPYHEETSREIENLLGGLRSRMPMSLLSKRDPVGLGLAAMLVPALGHARRKAAERDAFLRGTALYLAILAYGKDKGAPPESLDVLVPDYLPQVPVDPFDGKPFRYRVGEVPAAWGEAKWGLYSIGGDFRDDGGTANALGCAGEGAPDILWLPTPLPQNGTRF